MDSTVHVGLCWARLRPTYLLSALTAGCFEAGRDQQDGGAKYGTYGGAPLEPAEPIRSSATCMPAGGWGSAVKDVPPSAVTIARSTIVWTVIRILAVCILSRGMHVPSLFQGLAAVWAGWFILMDGRACLWPSSAWLAGDTT